MRIIAGRFIRFSNFIAGNGVWRGTGWGIAAMSMIDGLAITIWGKAVTAGPGASLMIYFPLLGVRDVGIALTIVGAGLFCTVGRRNAASTRWLVASFVVGIFISCYTVGGWANAGKVSFGGLSKWLLMSWLSFLLAASTRRVGGRKDDVPH